MNIIDEQAEDYETNWKPLLMTDGVFDEVKIRNEMTDLIFVYSQVSKVYMVLTGGNLSKPMYFADVIISLHNDEIQKSYDEGYRDAADESGK